jgi:hypothetical protein
MHFREQLVLEKWLPDLIERAIPMSQVCVCVCVLLLVCVAHIYNANKVGW